MKAIIIHDSDAANLLDLLKLEYFREQQINRSCMEGLPTNQKNEIIDEIHRRFHFIVCRWLQEQGANVCR